MNLLPTQTLIDTPLLIVFVKGVFYNTLYLILIMSLFSNYFPSSDKKEIIKTPGTILTMKIGYYM